MAITKKDVKKEIGSEIEAWKTAPGKHKEFLSGLFDSPESEMSSEEAYEEEKAKYWDLRAKLDAMSDKDKKSKMGQSVIFAIEGFNENFVARFHWEREQERLQKEKEKKRRGSARGGSQLLVPVEMQDELPSRDLPDEDLVAEDMLEVSQEPDPVMEDQYVDFVLTQSLNPEEQDYLMGALEADPRLSEIFDKVVETASEFTGDGPVEGPGTGVSDSIPARLSDGEFVMTKEATDEIGSDNLERLMRDAENGEIRRTSYGGGLQEYAFGGLTRDDEKSLLEEDEDEIKKQMIAANRMPSVV